MMTNVLSSHQLNMSIPCGGPIVISHSVPPSFTRSASAPQLTSASTVSDVVTSSTLLRVASVSSNSHNADSRAATNPTDGPLRSPPPPSAGTSETDSKSSGGGTGGTRGAEGSSSGAGSSAPNTTQSSGPSSPEPTAASVSAASASPVTQNSSVAPSNQPTTPVSTPTDGNGTRHEAPRSPHDEPSPKKAKFTMDDKRDEDDDDDGDDDKNSSAGSSCHQCKSRRTIADLSFCTNLVDKKNKEHRSCRKKYCGHCLKKFYKEEPCAPEQAPTWKCPSCRNMCCCAACRRRDSKSKPSPIPFIIDPQTMQPLLNQTYAIPGASGLSALMMGLGLPPVDQSQFTTMATAMASPSQPILSSVLGMGVTSDQSALFSPFTMGMVGMPHPAQQNTTLALLCAIAQMPNVRKHIQGILQRKDVPDGQKVESIAALLRGAIVNNGQLD